MIPTRLAAGLVLLGAVASAAPAQLPTSRGPERDVAPPSISPLGTELFRGLFDFHQIRPVAPFELRQGDYPSLIVVILGSTPPSPANEFQARQALLAGGSLLVAIDAPANLSNLFPQETVLRVTDDRVYCPPADPKLTFRDNPHCPYVVPRSPSRIDPLMWKIQEFSPGPEWTLFLGRNRISTNRSAVLAGSKWSRYVGMGLAGFSQSSRTEKGPDLPPGALFAVGGSGGPGDVPFRSLVLADPGVFTNQMMSPANPDGTPATDNLAFAISVVQFLRGPESAPKSKCLFIEDGRVQSRFDTVRYAHASNPPVPPLPAPNFLNPEFQRKLTDLVNNKVATSQENNAFNRRLGATDEKSTDLFRNLAVAAAVLAILVLAARMWRNRHEPDLPPVPKDTGRIAGTAPPESIARRREEVLQAGHYTPLVQEYLRDLFADRGLAAAHDPTPRPSPPVTITGPDAKTLQAHLRILWDVAYGAKPRPITYSRWKELEPMIDAVRRAADAGRWQFTGGRA